MTLFSPRTLTFRFELWTEKNMLLRTLRRWTQKHRQKTKATDKAPHCPSNRILERSHHRFEHRVPHRYVRRDNDLDRKHPWWNTNMSALCPELIHESTGKRCSYNAHWEIYRTAKIQRCARWKNKSTHWVQTAIRLRSWMNGHFSPRWHLPNRLK